MRTRDETAALRAIILRLADEMKDGVVGLLHRERAASLAGIDAGEFGRATEAIAKLERYRSVVTCPTAMQNKPSEFDVCFEALREEPLPAYENDAYRVGGIIAASAGHTKQSDAMSGTFSILKGRSSGC